MGCWIESICCVLLVEKCVVRRDLRCSSIRECLRLFLDDICVFVVDGSYRVKSVVSVGSYRVASYRVKSVVSDRIGPCCVVSVEESRTGWIVLCRLVSWRCVETCRTVVRWISYCEGTGRACVTVSYRFSVDQLLRRYRSGVLIRVSVVGVYV